MQQSPAPVILAGDVNCVQHPALDRLASRTESPALDTLADMCQLVDALDLIPHPDDDLDWEPSTHLHVLGGVGSQQN